MGSLDFNKFAFHIIFVMKSVLNLFTIKTKAEMRKNRNSFSLNNPHKYSILFPITLSHLFSKYLDISKVKLDLFQK